jgi:hypothetical protein
LRKLRGQCQLVSLGHPGYLFPGRLLI